MHSYRNTESSKGVAVFPYDVHGFFLYCDLEDREQLESKGIVLKVMHCQ